ncbi:transposable element Tcb1 transposase [Trichonephila clavipes]|nr:transposable element Tcb1 transposase [Trichonephila clavipes]
MQEDPFRCTTAWDHRWIVRIAVMVRTATLRAIAQQIQSVTQHSMSSRNIRRHLQQSGKFARLPLLRLPLTEDYRGLRRQSCDERWAWITEWNDIVFIDESGFCLQHHNGWIRVWRHRGERLLNCYVMHRHTDPASAIMVWEWYWISLPYPSSPYTEQPVLHLWGVRVRGPLILSVLAISHSNRIMGALTWHAMLKSPSVPIRLNYFLGLLVLPIYHACTTTGMRYTTHYIFVLHYVYEDPLGFHPGH